MPNLHITATETGADIAAVQQLCRDFVTWQLDAFPEKRAKIETYFEPVAWERTLAELPGIHARPNGAMLLARLDAAPVGCVMYRRLEPGTAEAKRLFVSPAARGAGIGAALVGAMVGQARADGYRELWLETARFLTDAIRLYRRQGFIETAPPETTPETLRQVTLCMRMPL